MSGPLVSILMPVYNEERYIGESIKSLLAQTYENLELIIIDDGSNDNTARIVSGYKDPRIILVRQENIGLTRSLNKGIEIAKGIYIARMDGDDICHPERIAKQVSWMNDHPEVGVLGTGFQIIDSYSNKINSPFFFPSEHDILMWDMHFYSPIAHPSVMLRKSLLIQVGGYSSKINYAQDYNLWGKLRSLTRFSNLQEPLLYLRKHKGNISETSCMEQQERAEETSRWLISDTLKKDVPEEIIHSLKNEKFEDANSTIHVSKTIYELYNSFLNSHHLSPTEKKIIIKDATKRIFKASIPFRYNLIVFNIWRLGFRIGPVEMLRLILTAFLRNAIACNGLRGK